ncbi:MAG: T9SS type A sorting domain-containing protein [Bacteroidales bacterium]|nr:T9SS type A sorting domain-containing protein [Bacteroidales bacterium]
MIRIFYPLIIAVLMIMWISARTQTTKHDSTYLPQISITSINGFGPYVIGTERSNMFIVDDLPPKTSKIIMRMIDVDSNQVNSAFVKEGSELIDAVWMFDSDTMGLPLSPSLAVFIKYQGDSTAAYKIPYTVYPDTVLVKSSAGWGPFVSNNYSRTDTSWHNVPETMNTFSVGNLPPRTESVEFRIVSRDSTAIDSLFVSAAPGTYLDSVRYENVRMDQLPLSTDHMDIIICCNGGPDDGIAIHKSLSVIPQKPRLICKNNGNTLQDSLPVFIQDQTSGNALMIDIGKYAEIQNGPGHFTTTQYGETYCGPLSFDIIFGSFTIEAWFKYNWSNIWNKTGDMLVMSIDSLWGLNFDFGNYSTTVTFISFAGGYPADLAYVTHIPVPQADQWFHLAYTQELNPSGHHQVNIYINGQRLNGVSVREENFEYIQQYIPWNKNMKTKSLILGQKNTDDPSFLAVVNAVDEVRIWNTARSENDIKNSYKKQVIQDGSLHGYWNFDDRRNRLTTVSDLSYNSNIGILRNGACFIPQDPEIQVINDSILITSSNLITDSITFGFYSRTNQMVYSETRLASNSECVLSYDISSLPYTVDKLKVSEYFQGCTDSGFVTDYYLHIIPPRPMATPKYNWGYYFQNDGTQGEIKNSILISGLPADAGQVEIGLELNDEVYNQTSYTQNSVPYLYSLCLDGSTNYIETSQKVASPVNGTISLWFNTTSKKGGKIIGFSETQNGVNSTRNDFELLLEPDGSLRFVFGMESGTFYLYGEHAYNDGDWHLVEVTFGSYSGTLSVDGSPVDRVSTCLLPSFNGYWIIGRNHANKHPEYKSLAEYFEGSLAEIHITEQGASGVELLYKLDEGIGTLIHDTKGTNNGELVGEKQQWNSTGNRISSLLWECNMVDKSPGEYTLFARIFYPGSPENGAYYPLGKFFIRNPLYEDFSLDYFFSSGIGFFNEGVSLVNSIKMVTDFTMNGSPDWFGDFITVVFMSPDHTVIEDSTIYYYTCPSTQLEFDFDMGDAPPGSYLNFQFGYITDMYEPYIMTYFSFPVYINQMISPTVTGNFGPFMQAIAPGTMAQENTFSISTEHLDDLTGVKGVFYTEYGEQICQVNAVKQNDTTWNFSQAMGALSPPQTKLEVEYYLNNGANPALVEGPYLINIHKTRPRWFDFLADTSFHNISETGDSITFSIITPFEGNFLIDNSESVTIPGIVPLIGGTSCTIQTPTAEAYLKYHVSTNTLSFAKPPDFFQKIFNLGAGTASTFRFGFNYSQDNTYSLDEKNDLIATQNFAMGGSATTGFKKLENIAEKVKQIIRFAKILDTESVIISPSFSLTAAGDFEYASRQHLITDTLTGQWGSFGNLDVDANPAHHQAYTNSSSYRFYSGAMGIEFSVGAQLLEGLVEGDFGLDGRFLLGFGHSYNTIPVNRKKPLHSFAFQTYGRFYITVFWGWIERTVWGPKMFYSKTIWGDDMTNAFPPMKKKNFEIIEIPADSTIEGLLTYVEPVGGYSKLPMPHPQQSVKLHKNNRTYTWLEPGNEFGERNLRVRTYNTENGYFGDPATVTGNRNAICEPSADMIDGNTLFLTWTQSRHVPESLQGTKMQGLLESFALSLDIWYAIYDLENQSAIIIDRIDDDLGSLVSGRAEGRPDITILSDSRVLVSWQVADFTKHESDIWYSFIDRTNNGWHASEPAILSKAEGIETNVKVESPGENIAVAVWLNTTDPHHGATVLMSSIFNGSYWTAPEKIPPAKSDVYINYFDMDFENGLGGLVWTEYVSGKNVNNHEVLNLLPWDPTGNDWSSEGPGNLLVDSTAHIQLPRISVDQSGTAAICCKVEILGVTNPNARISHVELFTGKLNNLNAGWNRLSASNMVCDTTKQVREMEISFAGTDTLVILNHEFIMSATNMEYEPLNGLVFGDPYMNQVLRTVYINEDGDVEDVNETALFPDGNDTIVHHSGVVLGQNYPNPCSSYTTFEIYLPSSSHVRLDLLDLSGHSVALLLNQFLPAGPYEIMLNTSLLKQGTYICRLVTDNEIKTRKMIVGK